MPNHKLSRDDLTTRELIKADWFKVDTRVLPKGAVVISQGKYVMFSGQNLISDLMREYSRPSPFGKYFDISKRIGDAEKQLDHIDKMLEPLLALLKGTNQ